MIDRLRSRKRNPFMLRLGSIHTQIGWARDNARTRLIRFVRRKLGLWSAKEDFEVYKRCMVQVSVKTADGDLSTGAAFHIGDGYLVSARHVFEGNVLVSLQGDQSEELQVEEIIYPTDARIDLAVLKTNFELDHYLNRTTFPYDGPREKVDRIQLGGHLDDWIGDELILTKVLLMGFPPVPLSISPVIVAVEGEVNAIVDNYNGPHPHFIISSIPRGGFSGGPVLSEYGFLLGVFLGAPNTDDKPVETGFAAAISIEPLLSLLYDHGIVIKSNMNILYQIFTDENNEILRKILESATPIVDIEQ